MVLNESMIAVRHDGMTGLSQLTAAPTVWEAAVAGSGLIRQTVGGSRHYALVIDSGTGVVECFSKRRGWADRGAPEIVALEGRWFRHPFARVAVDPEHGACAIRSLLVAGADWRKSPFYLEIERPRGIGDTAASMHALGDGRILALVCGRAHSFTAPERVAFGAAHRWLAPVIGEWSRLHRARSHAGLKNGCGMDPLEYQIFRWVRAGKRNADIAAMLGSDAATVRKLLIGVFQKLGIDVHTGVGHLLRHLDGECQASHGSVTVAR